MENKPPPDDNGKPQPGALAALDRSKQYLVAVAGILTVATQIWSIIEAQWRLAAVTVVLASIVVALYVVSHRIATQDQAKAAALRRAAIGFLIATPLVSILALVWYSYVPRYLESGTTIVVARFVGPKLPPPYQECRPSDMLVRTLARVGERFGGLTAYELPYSVDPENRFAELWAEFHGTVDAADVIVYGEYTLHSSSSEGTEEPDEIVINPEVARVPTIPLQFKSPPLYVWDFPSNVVKIQQLCGGDLEEAAAIPRFLDDGRRIADAIVGLQELGHEDFVSANAALEKARNADPTIKRSTSSKCARQSLCTDSPGVLAFYLGTLDEALGHYVDAKQAYAAAARIIGTSTPFVNLGEIDAVLGDRHDPSDAFKMFDHAVELDPNSVGAIATRSAYERDYLQSDRAAIDLERAMEMPAQNLYDILALSRAIYQRNQIGDAACAIQMLGKVIDHPYFPPYFDAPSNADTLVEYATWLRQGAPKKLPVQRQAFLGESVRQLKRALEMYPNLVDANYQLGLTLEALARDLAASPGTERDRATADKARAERYLMRAEYAPSNTYEDYLDSASAAADLTVHFDDRHTKLQDYNRAMTLFEAAIAWAQHNRFENDAYAYLGKAQLERWTSPKTARTDFVAAEQRNPFDGTVESEFGAFLGRDGAGRPYIQDAGSKYARRLSKDDEATGAAASGEPVAVLSPLWSAASCSNIGPNAKSDPPFQSGGNALSWILSAWQGKAHA